MRISGAQKWRRPKEAGRQQQQVKGPLGWFYFTWVPTPYWGMRSSPEYQTLELLSATCILVNVTDLRQTNDHHHL